ncbi:S9 family peptidase [Terricaulis silvestris]|uniref:Acyl-peptide hydrolase n=1 Tax=Terricaulis silvestris TaxID=2686094 RepID=A0A6I6MWA6_9CAUL|nr:alpha/beta fold hydrolase [Terricaulis silvestris]QGZ95483.1 Prolyl tripeptidyl peptidase precursor [Terricaulis silvestris]
MINRRNILLGATALSLTAACASTPDANTPAAPATYTAAAFFQTTAYAMSAPTGLGFSPDGRSILISNDSSGVFNAYALSIEGGAAVPLTASTTNATFAESYFPNDERVIVTADQGGNELTHVYVRERDGTLRDLTPGDELKADFLSWRDDGAAFYVISNERNPEAFDLYEYDATSYERRLVYENPGMEISDLSPNGRWLALVRPRTSADSDIFLVNLHTRDMREPRLITEHTGNISYNTHAFTPDTSALLYSTDEHGEFTQAWRYDLATGAKNAVIETEWDVMFITYSPTGRYQVSAVNADGSTEVSIVDTRSNNPIRLTGVPAGDLGGVRFNRDETRIAFTVAADTSPADVFSAPLNTGVATRLTHALSSEINEDVLVEATVVRYPSFDGREIPGILYRPRGSSADNRVPALVYVHGGPGGQSRRGYSASVQHLVNHGYAVFAANNRGSSGYGKTFFHLDDRHHGEVDLQDIVHARRHLETLDWVDNDRIGIMGGSYGGYMVAAALAFEPEAFDVGIDIFGVTNWERTLNSIPPWWASFREALYDEMGDPATDAERHRRISPLFHAANISKPLLVIQGANDPRVLQVESDELVAAVRANNVPVEYVVFPDEGHGFLRKENRVTAQDAYLRFLDQHLRGAAS